jgi:KaiC/GvpD/RAD55 family RecA-like ATPase
LSGGIPRGNVILLEGSVGTGKTTLGVEFVYHGATDFDEPGIIIVFEVSPDRIVRDAAQLGWDLRALERDRKVKINDLPQSGAALGLRRDLDAEWDGPQAPCSTSRSGRRRC